MIIKNWLIIGGSGRSGTSFLASSLINHPSIHGVKDVEFKIFSDIDGLIDLHANVCLNYSPDRARIAWKRFYKLLVGIIKGGIFSQSKLEDYFPVGELITIADEFGDSLSRGGQIFFHDSYLFKSKSKIFLDSFFGKIFELILNCQEFSHSDYFVEKTPHNLLNAPFVSSMLTNPKFIHVVRDPRSIAFSLSKMEWGPGRLDICVNWVIEYFYFFNKIKNDILTREIPFFEIFIEEISPSSQICDRLFEFLSIESMPKIFEDANKQKIQSWTEHATKFEIDYLTSKLGEILELYSYNRSVIGERLV